IGDLGEIGGTVPPREDPSHMAVEEALAPRRMHVARGVGMPMMMPMLGRPPEDALLGAGLGEQGEDELEQPAGGIGAVREVAVIACPDGEDAQPVQPQAERQVLPGDAEPDRGEAAQMDHHEGQGGWIDNVIALAIGLGGHVGGPGSLASSRPLYGICGLPRQTASRGKRGACVRVAGISTTADALPRSTAAWARVGCIRLWCSLPSCGGWWYFRRRIFPSPPRRRGPMDGKTRSQAW